MARVLIYVLTGVYKFEDIKIDTAGEIAQLANINNRTGELLRGSLEDCELAMMSMILPLNSK